MNRLLIILKFIVFINGLIFSNPTNLLPRDSIPKDWFGNWKGHMEIINHTGKVQEIPMALEIHPTDTIGVYSWHILYGENRATGLRPYLLRTIDASKGHYQTDELNGLKIDTYLLGNKMVCTFIVKGSLITTIEENHGNFISWDLYAAKAPNVNTIIQTPINDSIPLVLSIPITTNQKAILYKVK